MAREHEGRLCAWYSFDEGARSDARFLDSSGHERHGVWRRARNDGSAPDSDAPRYTANDDGRPLVLNKFGG